MHLVLLIAAGYLVLAAETALRADWCPQAPYAGLVWALLPLMATRANATVGILLAFMLGLGLDGVGSHWSGIGVCFSVTTTFLMQRAFQEGSLWSVGRMALAAFTCSVVLSMAMCVVQTLHTPEPLAPASLLRQLLQTSAVGSAFAAVVGKLT